MKLPLLHAGVLPAKCAEVRLSATDAKSQLSSHCRSRPRDVGAEWYDAPSASMARTLRPGWVGRRRRRRRRRSRSSTWSGWAKGSTPSAHCRRCRGRSRTSETDLRLLYERILSSSLRDGDRMPVAPSLSVARWQSLRVLRHQQRFAIGKHPVACLGH
jgi:hypothetical protein